MCYLPGENADADQTGDARLVADRINDTFERLPFLGYKSKFDGIRCSVGHTAFLNSQVLSDILRQTEAGKVDALEVGRGTQVPNLEIKNMQISHIKNVFY